MVRTNVHGIAVLKLFPFGFVVTADPAGSEILGRLKHYRQIEFIFNPVGHYLKLQNADNADNPFGADYRFENAGAAFFGNLF